MAEYKELYNQRQNSELRNKVAVAEAIAAKNIIAEAGATENHTNRLLWAHEVFAGSDLRIDQMLKLVLALNSALAIGAITGVSDSAVQANVDDNIDTFATG